MEKKVGGPNLILILSGKRKSGKNYVFEKLANSLTHNPNVVVRGLTLSSELKKTYAKEHGLDYEKLLDSSTYKENYRLDMIRWSDSIRANDPSYFCRKAVETVPSDNSYSNTTDKISVWIVSDARRKTDLDFFKHNFKDTVKTIRVVANESVRIERNWKFTQGVDDSISECGLDDITDWDFIVSNNNDCDLEKSLLPLNDFLKEFLNDSIAKL